MPSKRQFGNIKRLPSGRFLARYNVDGQTVSAPKTFETRREADRWLTLEHARLLSGTWRDPSAGDVLLHEYAEHWLETKHGLKPRTRALYGDLVRRFIVEPRHVPDATTISPDLGNFCLKDIAPRDVEKWHQWVKETSALGATARWCAQEGSSAWNRALRAWARDRGMDVASTGRISPSVVTAWRGAGSPPLVSAPTVSEPGRAQAANAYKVLSAILAHAVDGGIIGSSPCRIKGASSTARSEVPPATPAELLRIADAMPPRYRASVVLATAATLRAGEVFGLARRHVDLERGTLKIDRSLTYVPGKPITFGTPKSAAGRRTIHLKASVVATLRVHMDEFVGPLPDSLIFSTSNGTPVPSSNRTQMFRRAALAAGRPDLHFHTLRHTGASIAAEDGAGLPQLMRRLGHSSAAASLIYLHATDPGDLALAERLSVERPPG